MSRRWPSKPDAWNAAMTLQLHTGSQWREVAGAARSAGAGVESVVAVDFQNRMTDGVLKQQF